MKLIKYFTRTLLNVMTTVIHESELTEEKYQYYYSYINSLCLSSFGLDTQKDTFKTTIVEYYTYIYNNIESKLQEEVLEVFSRLKNDDLEEYQTSKIHLHNSLMTLETMLLYFYNETDKVLGDNYTKNHGLLITFNTIWKRLVIPSFYPLFKMKLIEKKNTQDPSITTLLFDSKINNTELFLDLKMYYMDYLKDIYSSNKIKVKHNFGDYLKDVHTLIQNEINIYNVFEIKDYINTLIIETYIVNELDYIKMSIKHCIENKDYKACNDFITFFIEKEYTNSNYTTFKENIIDVCFTCLKNIFFNETNNEEAIIQYPLFINVIHDFFNSNASLIEKCKHLYKEYVNNTISIENNLLSVLLKNNFSDKRIFIGSVNCPSQLLEFVDKDEFGNLYQKEMSKRLLSKKDSIDFSIENSLINVLKLYTIDVTSQLSKMLYDSALNESTKKEMKTLFPNVNIDIVTNGVWPFTYAEVSLTRYFKAKNGIEKYYRNKYSDRKLLWNPSLITCTMIFHGNAKYKFKVKSNNVDFLMGFNTKDSLDIKDYNNDVNIKSMCKLGLIKKESNTIFTLNTDFTSDKKNITL